jgi:hypothetical protein
MIKLFEKSKLPSRGDVLLVEVMITVSGIRRDENY